METKSLLSVLAAGHFRVRSPNCSMLHCLRLGVVSDGQTNILYCGSIILFKVPLEMGIKASYIVSFLTLEG